MVVKRYKENTHELGVRMKMVCRNDGVAAFKSSFALKEEQRSQLAASSAGQSPGNMALDRLELNYDPKVWTLKAMLTQVQSSVCLEC